MTQVLNDELAALRRASRQQLASRWRALFKAAPPVAFTPDLLARGIAWRLQEQAFGGLSAEARRMLGVGGSDPQRRRLVRQIPLRPGNRLVRRWRGRTYVVEIDEDGLLYDGERYSSLTRIATRITGTRWSGPKFFGLVK